MAYNAVKFNFMVAKASDSTPQALFSIYANLKFITTARTYECRHALKCENVLFSFEIYVTT